MTRRSLRQGARRPRRIGLAMLTDARRGRLLCAAALSLLVAGGAAPGRPALAAVPPLAAAPKAISALPVTPKRLLGLIRATFRSHRPPPPFVSYRLEREQNTEQGFHDFEGSYKEDIWCRSLDRASLSRRVYRGSYRGDLTFERPAFNEARDPGPPTADIFEPAPARPRSIEIVPTPEPTNSGTPLQILGRVSTLIELDYAVESVTTQGDELDVKLTPLRDPMRNRLRELFVDKTTYELHRVVATDLLFVDNSETYGVSFTVTFAMLQSLPVVTDIHGIVGDGYSGDGKIVDYHFKDIKFPATLPDWYFDPKQYAAHRESAPA